MTASVARPEPATTATPVPSAAADAHSGRPTAPAHWQGLASLTATGVLWGTIGIAVRLMQDHGEPSLPIAFWRLVCAAVVLIPVLRATGLRPLRPYLRRPGRLAAVSLGSLAFQLLYFFAVHDVGVAIATLITLGLAPVALTAGEAVGARTRPAPRTLAVLTLALAGLVLVTATGGTNAHVAPHPWLGIAESIASGLTYAASTSWSAPLTTRLEPLTITFATSAVGALLLVPAVAVGGWHVPHTATIAGGTVWLGVVTTVIAYGLFYAGLRSTPGSIAMILTLLEPVTAVILAAAFLDEPLTAANLLGGALLLAAVTALYLRPRH